MGGIITYLIFSFYFLSFCPIFFYFHSQIIHRTLNGRHHHVFNFSFILFFSIFYSYFHLQIIHRTLNRRYHHVFDFSFFFFFLIFIGRSFIGHSMGGIITYLIFLFFLFFNFHWQIIHRALNGRHHHTRSLGAPSAAEISPKNAHLLLSWEPASRLHLHWFFSLFFLFCSFYMI